MYGHKRKLVFIIFSPRIRKQWNYDIKMIQIEYQINRKKHSASACGGMVPTFL